MKKIHLLILVLCSFSVLAQQPILFNQFYMNPYLYNPAYAGVEGHSVFYGLYQQQWSGVNDAPTTIHGSFHAPLPGGIGIGFAGYNIEQGGLLNTTAGKASVSYLLTLDLKHHIRFGLSVGGGSQMLNYGELDDPFDPAYANIADNSTFALADFGLTYHAGHFNFGFSIPNLISYDKFTDKDSSDPIRIKPLDNLMLQTYYRGHLTDNIAIEPHVVYRYNNYGTSQLEGTILLHLYHVVWVGGTYREDMNFIGTAGVKLKGRFGLGYSYETGNLNIMNDLGPSHEIHLGIHLGKRKPHAKHTSSFINSKRPEEEVDTVIVEKIDTVIIERIDTVELDKPWELDETRGEVVITTETGEEWKAVVVQHVTREGVIEEAITWVPANESWEMIGDQTKEIRTNADGIVEIGVQYVKTNEEGEAESVMVWEPTMSKEAIDAIIAKATMKPDVQEEVIAEAPEEVVVEEVAPEEEVYIEEVVKGNHLLELPEGVYIVAGVFEIYENADKFSDELFLKGYHEALVGYVSEKGFYYTVIYRSENVADLKSKLFRERKKKGMGKIWIKMIKVNKQ
ncbi:type IX secretion system membrane protein PorP/SprF [Cyclobacteriaceae bacterium]|jgi:type IX secretion system PorP/SprF family membrane protein|nr:type IX secretion system membrane protein PorP/SprF [Cyclobacteriaceae bacterium]